MIAIPPPNPVVVELEADYYHILETVYWRETGKALPVTKRQFLSKHGAGAKEFSEIGAETFLSHCEVHLIRFLVQDEKKAPTLLGISKACCPLCSRYIQGVNQYRMERNINRLLWIVGKSHGGTYCWQFGNDIDSGLVAGRQSVARYVTDRVVRMVDKCSYLCRTESPQYMSSPEEDDRHSASLFRPSPRVSLQLCDSLTL